jgi:MATE family multidrug resistance protein
MSPRTAEFRSLVRLALPLVLAHAGNQLITTVDAAIVGRLGAGPLAAVGLGNAIFFFLTITGMGVMLALDPLVAQAFGAGDEVRARRLLWQGVWLSLGVGGVIGLLLLLAPAILAPFGIEPEVIADARIYLWLRIPGVVPFLLFAAMRSYLQAAGVTRPMVVAVIAANLVNFAAAWLLVFGGAALPPWAGPLRHVPAFGVAGAAVAGSITYLAQAVVLALFVRAVPVRHPVAGHRQPARKDLATAFRVGLPIGLQFGAEVGIFSLAGLLAGKVGTLAVASHQVALTLVSLSFTVATGLGAAGAVRVGRAIGAGDAPGTRRAGLTAIGTGAGFMALAGLAFFLFPGTFVRLLTDDPEVLAVAVPLVAVAAVFQLSDGCQGVTAGVLRGAGDTRFPFLANLVGHWAIGLPIAIALAFGLGRGVTGLWWGLCAGLTAVATALVLRFLRLSRRRISPLAAGEASPAPSAGEA